MAYWKDRETAARQILMSKSQKEIDKKLRKYYTNLSKRLIKDYESLYNEVLLKQAAGEQISPATLYKLDKYWELQTLNGKIKEPVSQIQRSVHIEQE